jgi:hypothetical protein
MKREIIFRVRKIKKFYTLIPSVRIYGNTRGDWAIDFSFLVWVIGFIFEKVL